MRRRNWRFISTGFLFVVLALGFYFFMLAFASTSTDPVELMRTVGSVSGTLTGISAVLILFGLIGKKI